MSSASASASASASIDAFLERFVDDAGRRAEAREAMADLFAGLHQALAREFIANYRPAEKPPKAAAAKAEKPACAALTAKGQPCPRRACADSDTLCAGHLAQSLRPAKAEKPPKTAKAAAAKAEKPACAALTAKGQPCPRRVCADSDTLCAGHLAQSLRPAKAEKPPKTAKAPKKKAAAEKKAPRLVPEHNHPLAAEGEAAEGEACDLCQTHGNAAAAPAATPEPPTAGGEFEAVSDDLQARLRDILANISEVDDAEAAEAEEESDAEEEAEAEAEASDSEDVEDEVDDDIEF